MAVAEPIRIVGLDRFVRGLRAMDAGLPKSVRLALNEAAQVVVDDTRPRIPTRTGRARASLRASSSRSDVRVRAGGARVPYYPWLDFGGKVGRNASVNRPFYKSGRYLWKSFAERRDTGEIQAKLSRALGALASSSGIEMTTT